MPMVKTNCYAVVILADNATFSLAVNRMVAFRTQCKNRNWNMIVVGSNPIWDNVFHMFAPSSTHRV